MEAEDRRGGKVGYARYEEVQGAVQQGERRCSCKLAVRVGHLGKALASVNMTTRRDNTYLQDPTREVVVIIDAAVALATLGHEVAVEP